MNSSSDQSRSPDRPQPDGDVPPAGDRPDSRDRPASRRLRWFAVCGVLLTLCFGGTLAAWARHAWHEPLHSHGLLIPLVVAWLIGLRRDRLPRTCGSSPVAAGLLAVAGAGLLALGVLRGGWARSLSVNDALALQVAAWLCLLAAAAFALFGRRWLGAIAFPVMMSLFMIPLPDAAVAAFEGWLMRASADAAHWLFQVTGTPVFREGQVLMLPGMVLEVARECSGIRSTWVLLITSLLASWLFLRAPWRRAVLIASVIPLGILRNALRIVVIGMLCVARGPQMLDSWIHRRGGPVFFAASLVPLLVVAWCLWWSEARAAAKAKNRSDAPPDCGQDHPMQQEADAQ